MFNQKIYDKQVNISWLEPLLQEVISNPGAAVSPVIDNIDGNTFEYKGSFDKLKGGLYLI